MTDATREKRLIAALTTLADTLVADYDVVDLMHTLVEQSDELLDASATGLLLADPEGDLEVIAASNAECLATEHAQVRHRGGPCLDAFSSRAPVAVTDIDADGSRWPEFRDEALAHGYLSVDAFPLTLRDMTIGAMTVYRPQVGCLDERDRSVAQALADMATIGILQERTVRERDVVNSQLQHALNSRVIIEQAKGIVAQSGNVDAEKAFIAMRQYARSNNLPLRRVAESVADRTIDIWQTQDATGA
ncbi:GAF and ANTAR domain-containing protein [Spelaeicoccus albus]|uniref:Transcriptional regulator with GAF, ATPase, and Fis domain n=1 Tax=Spelaeicoccus albus TaxID=1280376 RepID=A0A7Z0IIZ3_9MICO|nr:GAF and ANTAR domain-containing protein [Spelaeicoccus albus]NYI68872.1 transcriptional regulator with GAF, ATPase, and Fis domain [Spelaeicoccus albus]